MKDTQIQIILSAQDRMSKVLAAGLGEATRRLNGFQKNMMSVNQAAQQIAIGAGAAGTGLLAMSAQPVKAFGDLEQATANLRASMMRDGGIVPAEFEKVKELAVELGNKLPGTTADLSRMMENFARNGVSAQDVLGGVGKSAAHLAVVLEQPYDQMAITAARLKEASGVATKDFMAFMDIMQRAVGLGLSVTEMEYAFQRSKDGLQAMGLQGLEASKSVSVLMAMLVKSMGSAEMAGTTFKTMGTALMHPEKVAKLNAELAKFGVGALRFTDKSGAFLGIEHMLGELSKLKKLNDAQLTIVADRFLGGGADAGMFKSLAMNGVQKYNETTKQMAAQADLDAKVQEKLKTFNAVIESMQGTWTNTLAEIGSTVAPALKDIANGLSEWAVALQKLVREHPTATGYIFKAVIAVGAFMTAIGGIAVVVAGVSSAFAALAPIIGFAGKALVFFMRIFLGIGKAFASGNVWLLAITAIAYAAFLIYDNWEPIKAFFVKLWADIQNAVKVAWETMKGIFTGMWNYITNLGQQFYDAGANIINSIVQGIKDKANAGVEAIAEMTKKMRAYLPFSPAKEGAFKDIHRVKIVETIASTIQPAPVVNAMRRVAVAGMVAAAPIVSGEGITSKAQANTQGGAIAGGSITINYSPQITVSGGAGAELDIRKILKDHAEELYREIKRLDTNSRRTSF